MSSRADLWAALLALLATGCIQRYPAPVEPLPVDAPYSSVVSWKGIELPAPGPDARPLPTAALRLAIHDGVYADAALVGGSSPLESWPDVLALLSARTEPIALLIDASATVPCDRLRPFAARLTVAVSGEPPAGESLSRWCDEAD